MNKEKAIKEIKKASESFYACDYTKTKVAESIISKIDEHQKVVIPKFVGEWIEEMKQDKRPLYSVMSSLMNKINNEWTVWKGANMNFSEIVAQAWIYGYEIEKEVLYTVEIPNLNSKSNHKIYLCKDDNTGKVYLCKGNFNHSKNKNLKLLKLTESEIKKDFYFLWMFAKHVEEN